MEDFALWAAYYEIEPWGQDRADYRAAIVAFTTWTAGYALSGRKPPSHVKVEDFLVVPPEGARKQRITDPKDMEALFRGIHAQMQAVAS